MKIWFKLIQDEKIIKSFTYHPNLFDINKLTDYIEIACNELDEPTPIILRKHIQHLNEFNTTKFKQIDFVETINFDKMVVEIFDENFKEKK